jgi:hypothetical protein
LHDGQQSLKFAARSGESRGLQAMQAVHEQPGARCAFERESARGSQCEPRDTLIGGVPLALDEPPLRERDVAGGRLRSRDAGHFPQLGVMQARRAEYRSEGL